MDDMWLYSLFTLLMLLLFEGTVVLSRTRNLRMLREMMPPPVRVLVFRKGAWETKASSFLLPVCVCIREAAIL
jgi:cation-transporting ATPase 13A1